MTYIFKCVNPGETYRFTPFMIFPNKIILHSFSTSVTTVNMSLFTKGKQTNVALYFTLVVRME